MANLDVSDVLLDPDFMDKGLICKRIKVTISNKGRDELTETVHKFNAVVTSIRIGL